MHVTVAICTWNRAALLAQTLEQMRQLVIPPGVTWELIVVNNNCTDDTDQVITRFADALPIRRVFEPTPGLSHARNAAIARASGELILWTDDDVLVSPQWLAAYVTAAHSDPGASFFGGPIQPWLGAPAPKWFLATFDQISDHYSLRSPPQALVDVSLKYPPYGANFVVRSVVQRQFLYDGAVGHREDLMLGGEDVKVLGTMIRAGHRGRWVHEAVVHHFIPKERLRLEYIRKRAFDIGRLAGSTIEAGRCATIYGRPRWLLREAIEAELRYPWHRIFRGPRVWINDLFDAGKKKWGMFWGLRAH